MEMIRALSLSELLPVVAILTGSAFIQGTVGFAFGLFAVPLLVGIGVSLPLAVPMVSVAMIFQTASGVIKHRTSLYPRSLVVPAGFAAFGLIAGVFSLTFLNKTDPETLKQVVGAILFGLLIIKLLLRPTPRDKVAPVWGAIACGSGGFISGLVGMGGPPIVIWALAHTWKAIRIRVTLWAIFLFMVPLQLVFYRFGFGPVVWKGVLQGVIAFPLVLGGTYLGITIGDRLNRRTLTTIATIILFIIALQAVLSPWLPLPG